jgi:hypothetical protein
VLLAGLPAQAQSTIRNPGDHPKYSVELEPHGVFQYVWTPYWMGHDGFGLGLRASIPFLDNGPISTINNNMAISFGGDWVHFSHDWCAGGRPNEAWPGNHGCSANAFWFPVVLQWNFFLTDIISVFGEPGLALVHDWLSGWEPCGTVACEYHHSYTHLEFAGWGGARFLFGQSVGLTVRVGVPSITLGASFLL